MVINFRNEIQKALWDLEYKGQFSDGRWENSPVHNWKLWCSLESNVNPSNIGTDIRSFNLHYNLEDIQLMQAIGYRMLGLAKVINRYPNIKMDDKLYSLIDRFIMTDLDDNNKDYKIVQVKTPEQVIEEVNNIGFADYKNRIVKEIEEIEKNISLQDIRNALISKKYTIRDLMKEIKDMKEISLTKLNEKNS